MGGGNVVSQNLIFNMVRETDDHGPFNSWSRIPFDTTRGASAPKIGALPAVTNISHNLIIMHNSSGQGTTGGLFNLCHDDGAAFYNDSFNFLVYGGVKNYLGEQKNFEGNVIVEPDSVPNLMPFCFHEQTGNRWHPSLVGGLPFGERFVGNTCVMSGQPTASTTAAICASACRALNDMALVANSTNIMGHLEGNTYINVGNGTNGTAPYFSCRGAGTTAGAWIVSCPSFFVMSLFADVYLSVTV